MLAWQKRRSAAADARRGGRIGPVILMAMLACASAGVFSCSTSFECAELATCTAPAAPDPSDASDATDDAHALAPRISALNYTVGDTAGGGNPIVITGTNLKNVTRVLLAGEPIPFRDSTDTSITFELPAKRAGEATVRVITPQGVSGNLQFQYWTPSGIDGLDCYVDAAKGTTKTPEGALLTWLDQGPNQRSFSGSGGSNPVQVLSTFGPTAGIRFTPQQWLRTKPSVGPTTRFSYFAVAKWTSADATPAQTTFNPPLTILSGSGGWSGWGVSAATIQYKKYDKPAMTAGAGLNDGKAHLIGMTSDASPTHRFYVGDEPQGTPESPGGVTSMYYDTIGAGYSAVDGFDGDLGAVIVVAREMTSGEIGTLNQWARQRFGTP